MKYCKMGDEFVYFSETVECLVMALLTIMVLSTVTNLVVILMVVSRRRMKTAANTYVMSLSCADLIIGTIVVGSAVENIINTSHNGNIFRCFFIPYFELLAITASILSLMAITVDRYRAVVHHALKRTSLAVSRKVVCMAWFVSALYALRVIPQFRHKFSSPGNITETNLSAVGDSYDAFYPLCNFFIEDDIYDLQYRAIDFIVLYLVPLVVMTIVYSRLISFVWIHRKPLGSQLQQKRKIVKMLIASVGIFFLCWVPFYLVEFVTDLMSIMGLELDDRTSFIIRLLCVLLSFSNSFINPIIYAYFNKNFYYEFLSVFAWFRSRKVTPLQQVAVASSIDHFHEDSVRADN